MTTPPSKLRGLTQSIILIYPLSVSEETNSKGMKVPGLEQQNFLTRFNVINVNKVKKPLLDHFHLTSFLVPIGPLELGYSSLLLGKTGLNWLN